jgi:hypothetical protein
MRRVGRELRGFSYKPQADPPQVTTVPWNQLVVTHSQATKDVTPFEVTFTVKNVFDALLSQLSITAAPASNLEMKLSKVSVWCVSEGHSIRCSFYSLHPSPDSAQVNPLCSVEDAPAENHWARVGFDWPISEASIATQNSGDKLNRALVQTQSSAASSKLLLHAHVMWRAHSAGPPSLRAPSRPTSTNAISRLADRLEEVLIRTSILEME